MLVRVHMLLRDPPLQRRVRRALEGDGVLLTGDGGAGPVVPALSSINTDVMVVRESLVDPAELAQALGDGPERPLVVLTTSSEDGESRAALLATGVDAVVGERDEPEALRAAFEAVLARRSETMLLALQARSASRYGTLEDFVAESPRMRRFVDTVKRVAPRDSTVLLLGETGVGKERLAHVIHDESSRAGGPFVAINCAALPESLLESELFGHEPGAFTDAKRERRGKFELAHRGTIFLDEIGDMPLHLQSRLLRVLQEREVERLGAESPIEVDVRVIAATNADLKAGMAAKTFRADLYYRLSVVTLDIPPLRDRKEDIPTLTERLVARFATQFGHGDLTVSDAAIEALLGYDWPGNVRELANVMERAALLVDGDCIQVSDLPDDLVGTAAAPGPDTGHLGGGAWGSILPFAPEDIADQRIVQARERLLEAFERWYLTRLLEQEGGKVAATARRAGLDPRSLYDKLKRYGIDKRTFKGRSSLPD